MNREKMFEAIREIGTTDMHISEGLLGEVESVLKERGYMDANLLVSQSSSSVVKDELHRVLASCERHRLDPALAAEIIQNLNRIESGSW